MERTGTLSLPSPRVPSPPAPGNPEVLVARTPQPSPPGPLPASGLQPWSYRRERGQQQLLQQEQREVEEEREQEPQAGGGCSCPPVWMPRMS